MGMQDSTLECRPSLSPSQIADLRLAASQMSGPKRRAFEAEMALKHCGGNPLRAATLFGWGRQTVARGLAERRSGILCLGAQSACSGRKRWEERHPQVAEALRQLADAGIRLRRDSWVSVMYSTELNSATSSVTPQRTDRHGILGEKPSDFQLFS